MHYDLNHIVQSTVASSVFPSVGRERGEWQRRHERVARGRGEGCVTGGVTVEGRGGKGGSSPSCQLLHSS